MIQGEIDTTYHTQQRDMFASGLAAEIGVNAFAVWHAIKSYANFSTGEAWPGVRTLMKDTGLASSTVQNAIKVLVGNQLLRAPHGVQPRKSPTYIARERLDVRVGKRVLCTIVLDYVPISMRERLAKLQEAATGQLDDEDVWANVDVIPGPGMVWDADSKTLKGRMRADEVPMAELDSPPQKPAVGEARKRLKLVADEMRRPPELPTTRS